MSSLALCCGGIVGGLVGIGTGIIVFLLARTANRALLQGKNPWIYLRHFWKVFLYWFGGGGLTFLSKFFDWALQDAVTGYLVGLFVLFVAIAGYPVYKLILGEKN